MAPLTKIGFIGLGLMGKPMAKNLQKAGYELSVYNRTKEKTEEFKGKARICRTPAEAASNSDIIITMVTGPGEVKELMLGKNGVAEGSKEGLIAIDMSTIGPTAAKQIASELQKKEIDFIDAPVTGSTPAAESGELTIFVGGRKEAYEKAKPILSAMGKKIHYTGPTGTGQAIKLVNNLIVAISICAVAEGIKLADSEGIQRTQVIDALENTPAMSQFMKMKMNSITKNDFKTLFSTKNMEKDIRLALEEAAKTGSNLPVALAVDKLFLKAKEKYPEEDISAVFKALNHS